ncbi:MAG: S28 family serine protease [Bacteroides sp.]
MLLCWTLLTMATTLAAQSTLQQKLQGVAAITEIKPLQSTEFTEKYLTRFTQPLDHKHPEKGSFSQRVIISHVGFDRPTVLVTEGYGAAYALNAKYREEISKLFDANMVFVEYRYFLESTPTPKDWQYLTAENSADDLHAIREALRSLYPGKWIATGISKGGQTTMLYRTFYPDDVDISVPYVAPLCYGVEDGRHEPFIRHISTPADRQKIEEFQLEVLKRKATLLPRFEKYCNEKGYRFNAPIEEILDFCVLEYSFALWQWGTPLTTIPASTADDDAIFAHLLAISEPSYFANGSSEESFFVQAARELGYYGYDTRPFKKYLSITSAKGYLERLMLPAELKGMPFDKTLGRKITKYLKKNDPKMIFIYGENDPWTAAGVTWLKGKQNTHVFIQPGGSHRARIHTMPEATQEEIKSLIRQWLDE